MSEDGREYLLEGIRNIEKDIPITWDRVVDTDDYVDIYGWIPNIKRDDFVLLRFEFAEAGDIISFTTSSAKYCEQMYENLIGDGNQEHFVCIKFNEYF